jgi:hypothetical protein
VTPGNEGSRDEDSHEDEGGGDDRTDHLTQRFPSCLPRLLSLLYHETGHILDRDDGVIHYK